MFDTILGLLVVFAIIAAVASAVVELWVRIWGLRMRNLRAALIDLLDAQSQVSSQCCERQAAIRLTDAMLSAYRRERALDVIPGSMPPEVFARLLLRLGEMHPPVLRRHLADITQGADDPHVALAQWFATAMEEVSARWRWRTRLRLAVAGIVLAIVGNVDAIFLFRFMLNDHSAVATVVQRVKEAIPDGIEHGDLAQSAQLWLFLMHFPVGWPPAAWHWAVPLGWLLTGVAASLGAPFWWDLLRSMLRVRGHRAAPMSHAPRQRESVVQGTVNPVAPSLPDIEPVRQALAHWQDPAARAVVLAACSAVVYAPPWQADAWWQELGVKVAPFADTGVGTQGAVLDVGPSLVVVFRGTEMRAEDWATDARFVLTQPQWLAAAAVRQPSHVGWWLRLRNWWRRTRGDLPLVDTRVGEPAIHSGFSEALSDVLYRHLHQLVRDMRTDNHPPGCIWTGHSLGGALATLAAARCVLKGTPVQEVSTFGQPRVGNAAFAAWYQRQLGAVHYTYAGVHDPVSLLPPVVMGYAPVGQLRLLHASGSVESTPPLWYQHLAQGTALWHDGSDALQDGAAAHGINATLDQLMAWWDTQQRGVPATS
ncbi:MAG: hypothetical protein EA401_11715 [Planctomycetota bacterium]|nr:MAG: hypothetical protein EA401_11715 [Planctomycetota bacterium]